MLYDLYEATIEQVGLGGFAMYPLLLTCLAMWVLIFKKIIDMRAYTKGSKSAADCISSIGKPDFSCSFWQRQLMDGYVAEQTTSENLNRNIVNSLSIRQKAFIDKHTSTIAVLAGIAPLLGLLGTVMGMISTFEVISMYGTGNARALAGGISEALITTETGLIIAVPGLFFVSFLSRQANEVYTKIQRFCILLLDVPLKK
ncbi:MAG: MotA/TolQ/ExbB proton channel family protein [Deltaproteobacteria bacterium]|nr:MotA/TolQ/ExbB proton channel family protein [Deltaproteobacteria bacterium]